MFLRRVFFSNNFFKQMNDANQNASNLNFTLFDFWTQLHRFFEFCVSRDRHFIIKHNISLNKTTITKKQIKRKRDIRKIASNSIQSNVINIERNRVIVKNENQNCQQTFWWIVDYTFRFNDDRFFQIRFFYKVVFSNSIRFENFWSWNHDEFE